MTDVKPSELQELPTDSTKASRQLTHAQINRIVRIWLMLVIATAFGLTILAAHPGYRYFGIYSAAFNVRNPIQGDSGTVAAYVTASDPAIVAFPKAWGFGNEICLVLRIERTDTPTQVEFDDYAPQIRWNDSPNAAVVVQFDTISGNSSDGSELRLMNNDIRSLISAHTSYRVQWLGQEPTPIYPNQAVGGLLCARFQFAEDTAHIAPLAHISVSVHNVHVEAQPAFYFSFHDDPPTVKHPPETVELTVIPLENYLDQLAADAPFAVRPLSAAQSDQRATEVSQKLP